MRIRESELQNLSRSILDALVKQGFVRLKGDAAAAQKRIVALLVQNLEEEAEIEREAERLAESHARKTV
ncbi:MAG TPA: DUF507 family protein, partial [Candidatus Acidoferrales bacterium]|nr:DUF507 family protein [Candidatus Acidoferrales bacterium]